jgi:hypothetical protein
MNKLEDEYGIPHAMHPISLDICKSRLQLFGHILRLPHNCPAQRVIDFYCSIKKKVGPGPLPTLLPTVLEADLRIANIPMANSGNIKALRSLAADRGSWINIIKTIVIFYRTAMTDKAIKQTQRRHERASRRVAGPPRNSKNFQLPGGERIQLILGPALSPQPSPVLARLPRPRPQEDEVGARRIRPRLLETDFN